MLPTPKSNAYDSNDTEGTTEFKKFADAIITAPAGATLSYVDSIAEEITPDIGCLSDRDLLLDEKEDLGPDPEQRDTEDDTYVRLSRKRKTPATLLGKANATARSITLPEEEYRQAKHFAKKVVKRRSKNKVARLSRRKNR